MIHFSLALTVEKEAYPTIMKRAVCSTFEKFPWPTSKHAFSLVEQRSLAGMIPASPFIMVLHAACPNY